MVIERSSLKTEIKPRMREGKGDVALTHLGGARLQKHLRLLSEIVIPPGSSIGQHPHLAETEYYIILEGTALVNDNGAPIDVAVVRSSIRRTRRVLCLADDPPVFGVGATLSALATSLARPGP